MKQERTRPGVMIYFEDFAAADQTMTDEQMGKYIRAIVHYAKDGEWQDFTDDPVLKFAFIGAKPKIDRDGETYERKKLHGQYMTYVREAKENGEEYLKEHEWIERLSVTSSYYQKPIAVTSASTTAFAITPAGGYKGGRPKKSENPVEITDDTPF